VRSTTRGDQRQRPHQLCASRPGRSGRRLLRPVVLLSSVVAFLLPLQAAALAAGPTSATTSPARAASGTPAAAAQNGARSVPVTAAAAPADDQALIAAYAAARHLPKNVVAGVRPGSLHLAEVPATGLWWAIADFTPSAAADAAVRIGFQDGASTGVFSRAAGQPWHLVQAAGAPYECSGALSAALRSAWQLPAPAACGAPAATVKRAASQALAAAGPAASLGQAVADIALSQVGVSDTPAVTSFSYVDCDPYSTLVGPPTPNQNACAYNTNHSVENTDEAWCSDFAKWAWQQAGVTADMNDINAGSTSFTGWAQAQGQTLTVDSDAPAVGDAVVFYPPGAVGPSDYADHVGIVTAVNPDGTVNLVNGDFLGASNISVQYDTDIDLSTWASQVWNQGEQWVFVAPPTTTQPPVPNATVTGPHSAVTGTAADFRAVATEPGGSITQYLWTFGNGATATGATASHVFTNAGMATVTMTATSSLGTVITRTWNVDVFGPSSAAATTPNAWVWYSTELVNQSFFLAAPSGSLSQDTWDGASWLDTAIPGQAARRSHLAVLNYADPTAGLEPHVFYRSAAGRLTQTYEQDDGTWGTQTLAGRPAAGSPIVATTGADPGPTEASPEVFYLTAARHLAESVEQGTTWVTHTLPGPAARPGALALADVAERGRPAPHLFYLSTHGSLIMTTAAGTPVRSGFVTVRGGSLAALTTGPDGSELRVFYAGRNGRLAEATSSDLGRRWSARSLPGRPARGTALVAAADVAPSGALSEDVFYRTASGRPAVTAGNGSAWASRALPGTATAVLGTGDYPEPNQPRRLFLAAGSGLELDATGSTGGNWVTSPLPDTPATFDDTIELYAATPADDQSALSAAQAAGLPASQVTESFATAWADTLSGSYLVIAVGVPATSALYDNPCGWANPSGEDPGTTPFFYYLGPLDQLPGTGAYENGAAATEPATLALATDLAYYAVHGQLPVGVTSLPPATGATFTCSGGPL
jgi:CHAP domain/PKD domain